MSESGRWTGSFGRRLWRWLSGVPEPLSWPLAQAGPGAGPAWPAPAAALGRLNAADVEAVRFPATKFREGYDQNGVDNLLDKVAAALLHDGVGPPPLHWRDVAATRFTVTKFREGYDRDDVDTFLKRVVAELQRRERGRSV